MEFYKENLIISVKNSTRSTSGVQTVDKGATSFKIELEAPFFNLEELKILTKQINKRNQFEMMISIDDLVPQDHLVRKIDKVIDFNFIYDLVEDKYCLDNGRPSIDPVVLIKIVLIQYIFGIRSMRQTIKETETNVAYRWFLGYGLRDKIPHFSTFSKNYERRFKGTDLFEKIFKKILEEAIKNKLIDAEEIFIDSTHVKANANKKRYVYFPPEGLNRDRVES